MSRAPISTPISDLPTFVRSIGRFIARCFCRSPGGTKAVPRLDQARRADGRAIPQDSRKGVPAVPLHALECFRAQNLVRAPGRAWAATRCGVSLRPGGIVSASLISWPPPVPERATNATSLHGASLLARPFQLSGGKSFQNLL